MHAIRVLNAVLDKVVDSSLSTFKFNLAKYLGVVLFEYY